MRNAARFCAIALLVAIAGCAAPQPPAAAGPAAPAAPSRTAANPLDQDLPNYLRLPGLADGTPVRVGVILPFSSSCARHPGAGPVAC